MKSYLILEDGTVFEGEHFGSNRKAICEIVFNTSMTGYLELLTDPSYAGQGIVMTYPLIGNYGIFKADAEAERPWAEAFIVRENARFASNFRNEQSLNEYLCEHDVPGLSGIDTRALTKLLRDKGTMRGMVTTAPRPTSMTRWKKSGLTPTAGLWKRFPAHAKRNMRAPVRASRLSITARKGV